VTEPALRVAAVQAESVAGDVEANAATAARWAHAAADAGARLVVLPELFLCGYSPQTLRSSPDRCDVAPDDVRLKELREAAVARAVALVVGASVRLSGRGRSLSLLAFLPTGRVEVAYSKQHLCGVEQELFVPGTSGGSLLLGQWNVGLGVCYDGCFPEHARAAADDGALAYACPSAYVVGSEHRRDVYYAARALDNGMYVIFSGLVGRCGELEFGGGTAVYDPQGRRVASVDRGSGLAVAELDRSAIDEARLINPFAADRPASLGRRTVLQVPERQAEPATSSSGSALT
jgi:predicted amidohydrolase